MASQQDAMDLYNKLLPIFQSQYAGSNNPFFASSRKPNDQNAWMKNLYNDWSGLTQGDTPQTIDRNIAKLQSDMSQNSSNFYDYLNNSTGGSDMPGQRSQMQDLTNLYNQYSGVSPSQYVNPQGGSGGPVSPNLPPSTPNQSGPGNPVDPNQPLSTPTTPVNQSIAPSDITPYIPAASTQQQNIVNQAIQQSQGVANQNVQSLQDILGPYVQSQVKNWTDPNSLDYQSTMGSLNNIGRADAGTFGQSLASRLAPLIAQNQKDLGTGALLPSFLTQQSLVGQGAANQSTLGLEPLNRFVELQNWNMQKDLANQMASQGASAQFGSGIGGLLGGGLGAFAGNAMLPGGMGAILGAQLGGGAGKSAGGGFSWICTHLKKLKLATEEEVEAVHERLRSTIFSHPLDWLTYLYNAPRLVEFCDMASLDWKPIKEVLIDKVLAEPDPEKAWQIYRAECQRLTLQYAPELWTLEVIPC